MKVQFEFCLDGSKVDIRFIDENTIAFDGAEYYFDPMFVEYDNVIDPATGTINAYNIYRDDENELYMTLYQGYSDKAEIPEMFADGDYHDPSTRADA